MAALRGSNWNSRSVVLYQRRGLDGHPRQRPFANWLSLQFVQALVNPNYLNHLASQKYLADPKFVAYLNYLQYWTRPPYIKYLEYPGPTLKNLELLQLEKFRQEIISPERVYWLAEESAKASVDWKKKDLKRE